MMDRRQLLILLATPFVCKSTTLTALANIQDPGQFSGSAILEFVSTSKRDAIVVNGFSYKSLSGEVWDVPSGSLVNGASIPQAFWSYMGGPYSGRFREPSIIHDHFCDVKSKSHEKTHKIFYEAMLQNGVSKAKSWIMYRAVTLFGPKWDFGSLECNTDSMSSTAECTQNSDSFVATNNAISASEVDSFISNLRSDQVGVELRGEIDILQSTLQ